MTGELEIQRLLVQRLQRRVEQLEKELLKLREQSRVCRGKNKAKEYLRKEELKEAWQRADQLERELAEARRRLRMLEKKPG